MNQRNNRQKPNDAMLYGKMPPQAPDLEGAVLGAVMLEQSALDIVESIIYNPECFYTDANQRIWAAIRRMSQRGAKIDFMTVTEELRASGEIEAVGGSYYVTKVTRDVVSSANIEEHARIIVQKSLARDLIKVCLETIGKCYDDYEDIFDTIDSINNAITEIQGQGTRTKVETLAQGLDEAIAECLENREKEGHLIGTSTGIQCIDDKIGGLIIPDMTTIGAETGGGKTALGLNIAFEVSETEHITYLSLELIKKQLAYRKCSVDTGYAYQDIARGKYKDLDGNYVKLPDSVIKQLYMIRDRMANERLLIHDKGGLSVATFRNIVAYNKKKFGCTKYIIDYVQLMNANGTGIRFGGKTEEISYISNQIKSICIEYQVTVIVLSQFSRRKEGEKRLHRVEDLKNSGSLEQDSDNVILLFDPLKYEFSEIQDIDGTVHYFTDRSEIYAQHEKCRSGSKGGSKLHFAQKSGRITDPNQHKPDSFKINSNLGEAPQIASPF